MNTVQGNMGVMKWYYRMVNMLIASMVLMKWFYKMINQLWCIWF